MPIRDHPPEPPPTENVGLPETRSTAWSILAIIAAVLPVLILALLLIGAL